MRIAPQCVAIVHDAIIMSKALNDPGEMERRILNCRSLVRLAFAR
jgi:hypothetical protein